MNSIDLHIHSLYSDGNFSPAEVIDAALKNELNAISITDHDTMGATAEALTYCQGKNIEYLPGVEITTHIKSMSLHILGYYLDHTNPLFINFLETIQHSRKERNEKIFGKLQRMGIKLSLSDIPRSQRTPSQIGRPHIAQLLVSKGVVHTEQEAFNRYLRKNAAAYVQRKIMPTEQAISAIGQAQGIAVLAHPASLGMSEKSLESLILDLKDNGLQGIETYHPLHSDKFVAFLEKLCHNHKLIRTGGSDFHGRRRDKSGIGQYGYNKPIPGNLINDLRDLAPAA